jgi:hypothetical protein
MDAGDLVELSELHGLVERAALEPGARQTVLWCLAQLPRLYRELRRTYEEQFYEAIRRLVHALLKALAGPDAARVAEAAVGRLGALHERLGLRPLDLHPERRYPRRAV